MSALDFLARELDALEARGLRRRMRSVDGPQRAFIFLDGREAINFSSNNYLGLADSDILADAVLDAVRLHGVGSGASRLIVGNLVPHRRLEAALASFIGAESCLLFNSGYNANVGALSALVGPEDVLFSDELNHASLIDGCRLSRAHVETYRHVDVHDLRRQLASTYARRRFIVTDAVFSMDGDLAPLRELRHLADEFAAALVVDEAHAVGVFGPSGRGVAADQGVVPDVRIGTLGKAFGTFGAFVTGPAPLSEYLLNRARSFVFTTALPPMLPAASQAALEIVRSRRGDELRRSLSQNITQFSEGLRNLGLLAPGAGTSPIFPILIGDERRTMAATDRLLTHGVYAQGIRPPTVRPGTARLRFSLMASHTGDNIEHALSSLATLRDDGLLFRTS